MEKKCGRPKKRSQPKHLRKAELSTTLGTKTVEPEEQNDDTVPNKRPKKFLTLEDIQKIGQVHVLSVVTDLSNQEFTTGPWYYTNANKCTIRFSCVGSDKSYSLRLDHFLERGIPNVEYSSHLRFRWYSWIRFKQIAKLTNIPIRLALNDEKNFMSLLQEVNLFYRKRSNIAKDENLEPNRGPQCLADSSNLEQLYYYGKGTCKYYRKTTLLQVIEQRYGQNIKSEYLVNPSTPLIDEISFEDILYEVNRTLSQNYSRHLNKLEQYAGPQCNEDRICSSRVNYDVKFTSTSSKARSASTCSSASSDVCHLEEQSNEVNLNEFFLRKCHDCNKIRWLGKRAATKFVLGTYKYGEADKHVYFCFMELHVKTNRIFYPYLHLKNVLHSG